MLNKLTSKTRRRKKGISDDLHNVPRLQKLSMSIESLMEMIIRQHLNWLKSLLKQGIKQSVGLHSKQDAKNAH